MEGRVRAREAMALATATPEGAPSVRMVLLKGFDERGFVFFTGYESRKGRELAENPRAALLFHWDPLGRQVRVEGRLERTTPSETEAYFHTRPRGAQIAALASHQSQVLENRETLEARVAELEAELDGVEVPVPPAWGGFRLTPETYEFWQHRENRLHDRFRYRRDGGRWTIERLSP
jgi:pyridoxamine 5'-phosphate oxidase